MSTGRIALIVLGLLIAAGGIFLVVRGLDGADVAGAVPPDAPAAGGREPRGRAEEKAPRWQSFVRPGERATPPRPVVRFARGLADPFDRPIDRPVQVAGGTGGSGASGGGARPENPGFRLEGISTGTQPVALISGRAVREGDTISGFRVARIGRSAVTLTGPRGTRLGLTLGEGR